MLVRDIAQRYHESRLPTNPCTSGAVFAIQLLVSNKPSRQMADGRRHRS